MHLNYLKCKMIFSCGWNYFVFGLKGVKMKSFFLIELKYWLSDTKFFYHKKLLLDTDRRTGSWIMVYKWNVTSSNGKSARQKAGRMYWKNRVRQHCLQHVALCRTVSLNADRNNELTEELEWSKNTKSWTVEVLLKCEWFRAPASEMAANGCCCCSWLASTTSEQLSIGLKYKTTGPNQ